MIEKRKKILPDVTSEEWKNEFSSFATSEYLLIVM